MSTSDRFEIFLSAPPGLEEILRREVEETCFEDPQTVAGGVVVEGSWPDVWRANLMLRGAGRVLARFAQFRAMHLAQLDKRARKIDWAGVLPANRPIRIDVTCRKSRVYHAGAARQRIAAAIRDALGAPDENLHPLAIKVRIEDDLCTFSVDTSGTPLHKRGYRTSSVKAPLRETLAALFLKATGFDGSEQVFDPMCGSGTFVIEAAQMARGLPPGRNREFAFESLPSFDAAAWDGMQGSVEARATDLTFSGSDRDDGAIRASQANAERAGVADITKFSRAATSDATPPDGPPGLVIVNPPYGARIGNRKALFALYGSFGDVMRSRFHGWRVAMVTSDGGLAKATGLPFEPPGPPVDNGGLKVRLYRTAALS